MTTKKKLLNVIGVAVYSFIELNLGVNFQSPKPERVQDNVVVTRAQEKISQQPRYAVNMSDVSVCLAGPLFKSKSGNLYDQAQCYSVGLIDAFHSISVFLRYLRTGQA